MRQFPPVSLSLPPPHEKSSPKPCVDGWNRLIRPEDAMTGCVTLGVMRRLEPSGLADLAEAYAYPETTPWLRANMVASADGAATYEGKAGGLGSAADRRLLSLLRGLADVVVVGAATVRVEGY